MARPVTILYLITSTNAGGTEKALWELVRRLDPARFTAHVCCVKRPGLFGPRLAAAAAGFYSLGLPEAGGPAAALSLAPAGLRLARLVRTLRPQILHCFLLQANILGRLAGRLCRVPAVISSLRVTEARRWPHAIDGLTVSMVDCYTAVSEAVRQEAIARAGIAPEKIIAIPNGIDCAECPAPAGCAGNADAFTVALAGRLHRQKGHAVLLEALKLLEGRQPQVRALLFGQGPDEEALKRMAADLGIADRVRFMGVVEDGATAMLAADAVVVPSLWEGMPNAVLEAMALARPVVASRLPGMDELVQHGRTGLLCAPGSAGELAGALARLAGDPGLARGMGAAGRARVREHFSLQTTVAATEALYERLLGCSLRSTS